MDENRKVKAIVGGSRSTQYEPRYVIADAETGEILDDAQGYGYKTAQKAYAAYGFKSRDKDKARKQRKSDAIIQKWCAANQPFISILETVAFEIVKGSWGPDAKVDAKLVNELLEANGLQMPFSTGDFLVYWKKS